MIKKQLNISGFILSPQRFMDLSNLLSDIVLIINKKEIYDVKFAEIFIDINNTLNDIYITEEYQNDSIIKLLFKMEQLLLEFKNKIESKEVNQFEIMNECLIFKFWYYNILDLFPKDKPVVSFKLDEEEAETWWCSNFNDTIFVRSDIFGTKISSKYPCITDLNSFMKSVCFTTHECFDDFINKSSFNLFLRFYGGWKNFDTIWSAIYNHPGHMVLTSSEHCEYKLEEIIKHLGNFRTPEKSYLFCLNWRCDEGIWNVMYVNKEKDIVNRLIKSELLLRELAKERFYYYPNGKEHVPIRINREDIGLPSLPPQEEEYTGLPSLPPQEEEYTGYYSLIKYDHYDK